MKNKALALIKQYNMIAFSDSLTIAFSGGADSAALLYLMHKIAPDFNLSIQAVHINHMLRGNESDNDELFCKTFCSKLGIPFYSQRVDIAKLAETTAKSIEETAREVRYKVLSNYARGGKIATAHTLSDSVETIIFNLARGSGLTGLTGIPPVRQNIIRPLISSTREDIEDYCSSNNLDYCTDSTNNENLYSRNKIRNLVVPVLKEINSNLERTIETGSNLLKQDNRYLNLVSASALEKLKTNEGYNKSQFLSLDFAISSRILINILDSYKIEVSSSRIDFLCASLKKDSGKIQLNSSYYFIFDKASFYIEEKKLSLENPGFLNLAVSIEDYNDFPIEIKVNSHKKILLELVDCKEFENIEKFYLEYLKNLLDCAKIELLLTFRNRQPSDKINLAHRGISKSLKKLFGESRLTKLERDNLVIIQSGSRLAWVENYGVDKAFLVDNNTKKAIYIKLIEF